MRLDSGTHIGMIRTGDVIRLVCVSLCDVTIEHLTPAEAIELAAELVKLATPDAKPDTAPVSIM